MIEAFIIAICAFAVFATLSETASRYEPTADKGECSDCGFEECPEDLVDGRCLACAYYRSQEEIL